MRTIYLDGQYIKVNVQIIDAFAPGAFKAKGAFETMLVLDGVVMDVDLHINRLRQGLKSLSITPLPIDRSVFNVLVSRNKLGSARFRLMVWKAGQEIHVMAAALPYKVPHKKIYRVCLIKTDRAANRRLANVKSLDYEMFAGAYTKAQNNGFDEALLINRAGFIFESSRANIFWTKNKVLYTPPLSSGCLNGITRQQVIKQARHLGISVKEKNLTPALLKAANAAFLTNSLIGLQPVDLKSI